MKTSNTLRKVIGGKKVTFAFERKFSRIKFITVGFGFSSTECFFSQLKFIKHALRTTMTDEREKFKAERKKLNVSCVN